MPHTAGLALAVGGAVRAQAVAATLLIRLLLRAGTPLGGVIYLIWQRNKAEDSPACHRAGRRPVPPA